MQSFLLTLVYQATGFLSTLWPECLMFGLAAYLYVVFATSIELAGGKPLKTKVSSVPSVPTDQVKTTKLVQVDPRYWRIMQEVQQGNAAEALELTSKLPPSAVSPLPANVASSLLFGLSQCAELSDESVQQLKGLGYSDLFTML
eukprot:TRINITY_DN9230_c0_g4_i2.p1 TRINITY_DN9230_c0_g4~~TRINITY_DN9230_c0_g4_i2.p1  ORF type:complete len:144 (+),score=26.18 TRINITY_DN9230_c0_g4_i2:105-536(+)